MGDWGLWWLWGGPHPKNFVEAWALGLFRQPFSFVLPPSRSPPVPFSPAKLSSVCISFCCSNKGPQFSGGTIQVYLLTVLEVRSPIRVVRGAFLPEALGENPFPGLFQLLEAACIPWLCPCLTQVSGAFISFSLSDWPSYKEPCGDTGPMWIIQDNLPISRAFTPSLL